MKRILLTTFLLVLISQIIDGQTKRVAAAVKQIPQRGQLTKDFVPKGWEVYGESKGDLNGDGISDAALTLTLPLEEAEKLREPSDADDYESAPSIVVVLFGIREGGFSLYGVNGRLYPSDSDFRSYLDNKIEKGVLVINTDWGRWLGHRYYLPFQI